ncbi:RagB/SusD family nutrient uptake outer membrane protein [Aquimarina sp. RZ0]|uniref:RagB/SusD family nutrient uptake outer membrane protein n=1 Tax=Aquimarina sp. RZ0 TaxID=2607730 RepID=UPI0011F1CB6F|nr:RagB/SusD family nutrient uptake outer membrane protein [Aquimarina sp. RZ0]KAA1247101.1 RagB/SusD family nutrient uptake outer membrane protein [Aquimarina sp. RZ0]
MKNLKFLGTLILILLIAFSSCEDNLLDSDIEPINNNEPTVNGTITSLNGMKSFAKGVYIHTTDFTRSNYFWWVYGYHESMGDVMVTPWGNLGMRWVNQTESITLDDGTVINPPVGGTQPIEIALRNTRAAGSDNMTQFEWFDMYALNAHCNVILENIDNLTDPTQNQKDVYRAWALWWKAYAYHKIGLIYEKGLIVNSIGEINNEFVDSDQIIAESERLLTELETLITSISDIAEFNSIFDSLQIDIISSNVDLDALIENINTLKARNIVYANKVTDMTDAQWNQVLMLVNKGVSANDKVFTMNSENTVLNNSWLPGVVTGFWYYPSQRLIQDINPDDARLGNYFLFNPTPNPRGRGIQYGSTHFWKQETPIASTTAKTISMYYAGSWEENQLLKAEAKIRTGDIEGGLENLDAVRTFQNSGLPATVGTSLSEADALEEVRKERRLALIMRAVSFYDARRYGVSSGSRTGAHVLDAEGVLNTNATINYNYLDYWPVPAFETDFNPIDNNQN